VSPIRSLFTKKFEPISDTGFGLAYGQTPAELLMVAQKRISAAPKSSQGTRLRKGENAPLNHK
jgi:uncharacterized NAD(P)/FAD-binding protein YdhS